MKPVTAISNEEKKYAGEQLWYRLFVYYLYRVQGNPSENETRPIEIDSLSSDKRKTQKIARWLADNNFIELVEHEGKPSYTIKLDIKQLLDRSDFLELEITRPNVEKMLISEYGAKPSAMYRQFRGIPLSDLPPAQCRWVVMKTTYYGSEDVVLVQATDRMVADNRRLRFPSQNAFTIAICADWDQYVRDTCREGYRNGILFRGQNFKAHFEDKLGNMMKRFGADISLINFKLDDDSGGPNIRFSNSSGSEWMGTINFKASTAEELKKEIASIREKIHARQDQVRLEVKLLQELKHTLCAMDTEDDEVYVNLSESYCSWIEGHVERNFQDIYFKMLEGDPST